MPNPRWTHDRKLVKDGLGIVGVDEAGRGCLAGPVVAGAVIIPTAFFSREKNRKLTAEINDSKQFNEPKREILFQRVMELVEAGELYGATGEASVKEIEEYNIVGATCLAMQRAIDGSSNKSKGVWKPSKKESLELFEQEKGDLKNWTVLVDGRPMKKLAYEHQGLVKGDTRSLAIAMASMLAKVTRDRFMRKLHQSFPAFEFASNKGYGAPVHLQVLREMGPTVHHRPSFLRKLLPDRDLASESMEQSQLSFL
jgi:ribonuclease HII